MKKSLLSFLTILLSFPMFAQLNIRIGSHEPLRSNSGWNMPMQNFASVAEGQVIISNILDAVDRRANFEIRSTSSVDNAAAVTYGGKRYVLYNPNFINSLDRPAGNRWASISVLAHEVGHHLEGHTEAGVGSHPTIELEADEFSGYALRKMGATLAEAQSAMKLIASERTSSTHPAKHNRLAAIESGWKLAGGNNGEVIAKTPAPTPRQTGGQQRTGTTTKRQSNTISIGDILLGIFGQVLGGNISNGGLVVNDQSNVLQRMNGQWYQVGKLTRLNNAKYPFAIANNRGTNMYVDQKGNIVNKAGQILGLLQALRKA